MLAQATWYDICTMETDMLGLGNRIHFLLCTRDAIGLRDGLLKLSKEILVKLQDLCYVLLDR